MELDSKWLSGQFCELSPLDGEAKAASLPPQSIPGGVAGFQIGKRFRFGHFADLEVGDQKVWKPAARNSSSDDFADDAAGDVGEAEVAAGVAVGEFFVVEAEEVKDGGVEVVDVDFVLDGGEPEFVGGAVSATAFDAAADEDG